jgi:hypothetical protein
MDLRHREWSQRDIEIFRKALKRGASIEIRHDCSLVMDGKSGLKALSSGS